MATQHSPNAADAAGIRLFGGRDIGVYDIFSGKHEDFAEWVLGLEAEGHDRGMGAMMEAVKTNADHTVEDVEDLGPVAAAIGQNLYTLFARRTRGIALSIVQLEERGNGWRVLQSFYREFMPRGMECDHGVLTAVINPTWWKTEPYNKRPFSEVLLEWDKLISRYEIQSGEKVSNGIKCATILSWCPRDLQQVLRSASQDVRKDNGKIRETIRDHALGQQKSYAPIMRSVDDSMDVSAVLSGGGKGGGDRCAKCGKKGHTIEKCFQVIGFPAKGGGKKGARAASWPSSKNHGHSGGSGKGKGKDPTPVKCFGCGKSGH